MPQPQFQFRSLGNFIDGRFVIPTDANGEIHLKSPADFSDEIGRFAYSYRAVEDAIAAARKAFTIWKRTTISERAEYLRKYQAALKRREGELTELISREVGKPLWESKTEFAAMVNKIDITINESMRFVTDLELPRIMEGTLGACRYKPLGVMAVIGPFNFPGHLPNGHIAPALLTGNTIVFKPSEKTPGVGQIMTDCFQEAGLPPGVFNLVQGEKEVGRRLCVHEGVNGVLFTGSYEVGTRIKQDTLQQHWKLLALEMGGKNPAIIWEDADLDVALQETLIAAYITTGQRCSATSRIIVHPSRFDEFVEKFHAKAKAFEIGHPLESPFMGSLIDAASVDRYMKFLGIAQREGAEIIMRGKSLELKHQGNYVTPSICAIRGATIESSRKSVYQQTEMFAPNVAILSAGTVEEAIAQANITQYGLVCSVFSKDRTVYDKALEDLEFGLVNWNKSTVGASSKLPFGGLKKSGNHFPTALNSTLYCTTPVSSLEVAEPKANPASYPGLNWA
jgi:succinylglutamic semialdehyde dehydrogenase